MQQHLFIHFNLRNFHKQAATWHSLWATLQQSHLYETTSIIFEGLQFNCLTAIINQLWGKCLWINTHFGFYTQSTLCPAPPPPKLQCWTRVRTPVVFPSFKIVLGRKGGEGLISIKGWLSTVLLQTLLVKHIYLKPWASILFYEPKRGLLINEKHLL